MEMEGLEFKPKNKSSYPGHAEVLEYLQNFAKKYELEKYVKVWFKWQIVIAMNQERGKGIFDFTKHNFLLRVDIVYTWSRIYPMGKIF